MATLVSSDDIKVKATFQAIKQSITISTMLEVLGEEQTAGLTIPVPAIPGSVLKKVMEWCEHHRCDQPEVDNNAAVPKYWDKNVVSSIPAWDETFFDVDRDMVFQITNTANYLEIPLLLKYGLYMIASELRGKSPEQMRAYLKAENNFTPTEEAVLLRQNDWTQAHASQYDVPK